jgi:hypothetical protein
VLSLGEHHAQVDGIAGEAVNGVHDDGAHLPPGDRVAQARQLGPLPLLDAAEYLAVDVTLVHRVAGVRRVGPAVGELGVEAGLLPEIVAAARRGGGFPVLGLGLAGRRDTDVHRGCRREGPAGCYRVGTGLLSERIGLVGPGLLGTAPGPLHAVCSQSPVRTPKV